MVKPVPILGTFEMPKAAHWDPKRGCLFFANVMQSSVHKYDPNTGLHKIAKVGTEPIAFVIPIQGKDDEFIISYGSNVATIKWDGNADKVSDLTVLAPIGQNVYRANAGKVSPSGSLFIGCHSPVMEDGNLKMNDAALYAFYKNKTTKKLLDKVTVANGMEWSADGTKFFFIDSLAYTVESFCYNKENDSLSDRNVVVDFRKENIPGNPDGMAIDIEDKLWITFWIGYTVVRVDPTNCKIMLKIELDALKISSVVFAGEGEKSLYIATGNFEMTKDEISKYPHSGYIFEAKDVMVRGRPGRVEFDLYSK